MTAHKGKPIPVGGVTLLAIVGLAAVLSACGRTSSSTESYADLPQHTTEFDEDAAMERAVEELAFETYSSIGEPFGCTEDCSGHEAGFEWAKQNEITDGWCGGNSESFVEGCQAYADAIQEKIEEYRDES